MVGYIKKGGAIRNKRTKKSKFLLKKKTIFLSTSSSQTKKFGEEIAREIIQIKNKKTAVILALDGELGGGKTTFLQGLGRGLGIKEKILSPTFIIMKRFKISHSQFHNFYHIDCYRIKNQNDLISLSFKEIISSPYNIIAIEWAEKIKKIIPLERLNLKFEFINKNKRKIIINSRIL